MAIEKKKIWNAALIAIAAAIVIVAMAISGPEPQSADDNLIVELDGID